MGRQPSDLPDELRLEILLRLPVKSLVRFRCVSKSWKSLITDSQFIKLHLHRSSSTTNNAAADFNHLRSMITSPPETRSAIAAIPSNLLPGYKFSGTCNGVVCLSKLERDYRENFKYTSRVRLWNPATRSMTLPLLPLYFTWNAFFGFGYDASSDTYKVVALIRYPRVESEETTVYVHNMGDTCWRRIQAFDNPLRCNALPTGDALYVNNTLNWLATLPQCKTTDDPLIIFSVGLEKENCAQLSLPPHYRHDFQGFVRLLGVLRGCLCFCHNDNKMHFVIWQMKEFGVHESWTMLFNIIDCENIIKKIIPWPCFAMYMSENGDALMLSESRAPQSQAILYTQKDNTLELTNIAKDIVDCYAKNYIESLVSPC